MQRRVYAGSVTCSSGTERNLAVAGRTIKGNFRISSARNQQAPPNTARTTACIDLFMFFLSTFDCHGGRMSRVVQPDNGPQQRPRATGVIYKQGRLAGSAACGGYAI